MLLRMFMYKFFSGPMFLFPLGSLGFFLYLVGNTLGHLVTVFSLKKSPDCFPVIAAFYILPSGVWGFQFFYLLTNTYY